MMHPTTEHLLKSLTFGRRVAEEESDQLSHYFVETEQWRKLIAGDVDIVYGPKGSGKSALYALLLERAETEFFVGKFIVHTEDLRGDPAFRQLNTATDLSERQFIVLWKLYILSLISDRLRTAWEEDYSAKQLRRKLQQAKVLSYSPTLSGKVTHIVDALRTNGLSSIEAGLELNASTGAVKPTIKLSGADSEEDRWHRLGISINRLFEHAEASLRANGRSMWIAMDRLDAAFTDSKEVEGRALRALFRVYRDLDEFERIRLKIFLRSDVWDRITSQGFTEASHITRDAWIRWDADSLLDLIMKRALSHADIRRFLEVAQPAELGPRQLLDKFHTIFPKVFTARFGDTATFDWALRVTRDGTKSNEPRELIHLLSRSQEIQLESGSNQGYVRQGPLVTQESLNSALADVSKARLRQTLFAEFNDVQPWVKRLEFRRAEQTVESLGAIWRVSANEVQERIDRLVEVGFFDRDKWYRESICQVPILYRPCLNIQRGREY